MPTPPEDALLEELVRHQIPSLAVLYDRFAQSFETHSKEADEAEKDFTQNISDMYDFYCANITLTKPSFQLFRRAVIRKVRQYLSAETRI